MDTFDSGNICGKPFRKRGPACFNADQAKLFGGFGVFDDLVCKPGYRTDKSGFIQNLRFELHWQLPPYKKRPAVQT